MLPVRLQFIGLLQSINKPFLIRTHKKDCSHAATGMLQEMNDSPRAFVRSGARAISGKLGIE